MAKVLTNTSRSIQFLKTATPGRIGGLYSASISIKPGESITVSDADFASMTINGDSIHVGFIKDGVIDTEEEILEILDENGGGGGGGITELTGDVLASGSGDVEAEVAFVGGESAEDVAAAAIAVSAATSANTSGTLIMRGGEGDIAVSYISTEVVTGEGVSIDFFHGTVRNEDSGFVAIDVKQAQLLGQEGNTSVNFGERSLNSPFGETFLDWSTGLKIHSGSARPGTPQVGTIFFDTSLGQPLWWNGTEWVDAMGASLV